MIANNFKTIKRAKNDVECIYLALSDRETYKWKATEENLNAPVYTLFWRSGTEDNLIFHPTGEWKRFVERLLTIEKASRDSIH